MSSVNGAGLLAGSPAAPLHDSVMGATGAALQRVDPPPTLAGGRASLALGDFGPENRLYLENTRKVTAVVDYAR